MKWIVELEGGPRRVNHAAVAVNDKIYSFGGYCTGEDYKVLRPMDIHVLDTISLRWSAIPVPSIQSPQYVNAPFQRYGHTAVAYGELIYIWGGRNDVRACNVLFCFNTENHQWSKPKVHGKSPGARDGHSACVINHKMYMFGGYEEDLNRFSEEIYALHLNSMTWDFVHAKGSPPRRRDFHSATAIGNCMYIFGGRGGRLGYFYSREDEIYCNKIIRYDTISQTWTELNPSGPQPIGRRSHSAFLYRDQMYVFGGYNGILNTHFSDIYRFNPLACRWSLVKMKGKSPCARRRQCCCVIGPKVYLFGGTSPYQTDSQQHSPPLDGLDTSLMDHNDLHVLDFAPSLKLLCELVVIKKKLCQRYLPINVRWEIAAMTTNNIISRPLNNTG